LYDAHFCWITGVSCHSCRAGLLARQPDAAAPSDELPVLTPAATDAVGEIVPRFFAPEHLSALRKVSELLLPAALDAKTPEFIDFLIGQSSAERQHVYVVRAGRAECASTKYSPIWIRRRQMCFSPRCGSLGHLIRRPIRLRFSA
jgi:hypothetical protein